jgi:thiamine-phosphate diphosphorylase
MHKTYCPRCGSKLEKRMHEGRERDWCPACRVIHYDNPVPATAAVVLDRGLDLLLVRRGQEPGLGKWCLPGGFQETGETPEQCMLRELAEETGLHGRILGLAGLEMGRNPCAGEVLVAGFRVDAVGGALRAGDDASEAGYFPLERLPELAFQSHARIIERATAPLRPRQRFRGLPGGAYVVTSLDHLAVARAACRGGARVVQYREKDAPAARRLATAREIAALCRASGSLFVVNDQLDIAVLSGADGVHVGQDDVPLEEARELLGPGKVIGVSCTSPEQALDAERRGADYLGVGAVMATPTKEEYPVVGLEGLRRICRAATIPVAAIGGVNLRNAPEARDAGAKFLAMVREFQEDAAARVAAVNRLYQISYN